MVTVHDPRQHLGDRGSHNTPQRIYDYAIRRADEVIVHTEHLVKVMVDEIDIPRDSIHVIPHILLSEDTAPSENRQNGTTAMFFGRFWSYKGLEYLIHAEATTTSRVPDAKIVIVGTGEDFGNYRDMMKHPERFTVHNEYIPTKCGHGCFLKRPCSSCPT